MTACTWTIVTNIRTIVLTGVGTPTIGGANSRCASYNLDYKLLKLSGEPDGACAYADESIVSATSSNCVQSDKPCDCLNGDCVPKSTYGTPGLYANLDDCKAGCAKNAICTGECVDPAEIANLQQAVGKLQSKICK
jgi:hypothetical protein